MGTLAYAVGGGMTGLGHGLEEAGKQAHDEQMLEKQSSLAQDREEAIARLKDKFEKENIQGQQAFQRSGAQAAREFETGKQKTEIESKEKIAGAHETAATGREHEASQAKISVAGIRAAGSRKTIPEFTHKSLTEQGSIGPPGPDGKPTILPGRSYDLLNHKSGQSFVSVGDMYLPYNAADTQFPDPKSVARAPADKLQLLAQNPDKMMDFFQKYHYIPRNAISAMQQQKDQSQTQGLPGFIPRGTTAGPETGIGGSQESVDDNEDYANTGDNGPQPTDNTPAQ